jgi:hypothetical protein
LERHCHLLWLESISVFSPLVSRSGTEGGEGNGEVEQLVQEEGVMVTVRRASADDRSGNTKEGSRRREIKGGREGHLKRAHEGIVHTHHCPSVIELPAVVRSTEDRH